MNASFADWQSHLGWVPVCVMALSVVIALCILVVGLDSQRARFRQWRQARYLKALRRIAHIPPTKPSHWRIGYDDSGRPDWDVKGVRR